MLSYIIIYLRQSGNGSVFCILITNFMQAKIQRSYTTSRLGQIERGKQCWSRTQSYHLQKSSSLNLTFQL